MTVNAIDQPGIAPRYELYEAFGVYEAHPRALGYSTPTRRRVHTMEAPWCEPELTEDVSLIDLTISAGEGAPMAQVHIYGDDVTGAFVRVSGADRRSVDVTYDRLIARMGRVLEVVSEAFQR